MGGGTAFQQFKALVRRNILLKWRKSKAQVIMEFLIPLMFVSFLAVLMNTTTADPGEPTSFPEVNLANSVQLDKLLSSKFYVSPADEGYGNLVRGALKLAGVDTPVIVQFAEANESASAYINESSHSNNVSIIGVEFDENTRYALRFSEGKLPNTNGPKVDRISVGCRSSLDYCAANQYLHSSFALLQLALDTVIIRNATGVTDFGAPDIKIQMMPKLGWTPDLTYIQSFVSIYMVFAYSFFVNFLVVSLVTEKENKLKEAMRVMGMKDSAYWLSWGVTYLFIILIDSILCTLVANFAQLLIHSNMFLFFLTLFLYGVSIITLSFAITPFFNKANSAGGLASFATIVFSLLYFAVSMTRQGNDENGPVSDIPAVGQWLMSLISPIAVALTLDQAIYLDVARDGMTFDNIHIGQFPIYAGLTMLAIDIVLYGLLAVYFDNVIPGEYGSQRPPLYFLSASYWFPHRHKRSNLDTYATMKADCPSNDNQEDIHHMLQDKNLLRIFNIKKQFWQDKKMFYAVDGISLDIYEGQITALLGHNGAGKSTLINMLTGMTRPTSGTATIGGWDISDSTDMDEIRQMTGVCPQHNILFAELTCREHLELFGRMRGVSESVLAEQVPTQLSEVDLQEKIDTYAKDLSGGQKRKLSLAIALVGDPKILFLDEPTAGMDPSTRRNVWNLLKSKREGRVVLLTTHFMDEADILADRKAIISKGQLKCVGSSLFLKNRFGLGYHLSLVVKPGHEHSAVENMVTHYIPTARLTREHVQELVFTLPLNESSKFPGLLGAVEEAINCDDAKCGIASYGVSMTTLEEVFLKIGEDEETDSRDKTDSSHDLTKYIASGTQVVTNSPNSSATIDISSTSGDLSQLPQYEVVNKGLVSQQFKAFLKIRFLDQARNPASFFFRIVFPGIFILASAAINRVSLNITPASPVKLAIDAGMYAFVEGNYNSYVNPNATWQTNSAGGVDEERFMGAMESTGVHLTSLPAGINLTEVSPHNLGTVVYDVSATGMNVNATLTLLYNDTALHSLPAIINLMTNSLMTMMADNSSGIDSSNISVSSQPWPDPNPTANTLSLIGAIIMFGIALASIPTAFAVAIVHDRETKCRTQLRVAGITMNTYWAVLMFSDLLLYCIPSAVAVVVLVAFQIEWLLHGGAVLCLILLLIVLLPCNTLFGYVWSFAFSKRQTCMTVLPSVFIWLPMLPFVAVAVLDAFYTDTATILHVVFCFLLPSYPFFGGLNYIAKVHYYEELIQGGGSTIPVSKYFEPEANILPALLCPLLNIVLLYLCLRVLDVRSSGGSCMEAFKCHSSKITTIPSSSEYDVEEEDDDVAAERDRVNILAADQTKSVTIVKNLQKKFHKNSRKSCQCQAPREERVHVAVKNATFAVTGGEVFGLLGPNGAGKSTTLNAMIAETTPDRGSVIVDGHNIHSNLTDAYQTIGYCPQEDALWEYVTLQEHLVMYAHSQGIRKQDVEPLVSFYMKALDIEEHAKKTTKKLSGGTKRKLSLVISLLGKPRVVLMDEPSTGMDPKSKRFLWDTISSGFHGGNKAAVLTTHYMDEADALCTRVGIMVNGALVALGSTQHLKNKFGSGYVLEMKLSKKREENLNAAKAFVKELLPSAVLLEMFGERLIYKVPQTDIQAVSKIFSALETDKDTYGIEEYSFSQSTLEQVFLELAKHQANDDHVLKDAEPTPNSPSRLALESPRQAKPIPTETNSTNF